MAVSDQMLVSTVLDKMAANPPLADHCYHEIFGGIITGLDKAFLVDRRTRDLLVQQHVASADLLKPFLQGVDIKSWRIENRDLWLIYAYHGVAIEKYPAVLDYLRTFYPALSQRRGIAVWYELTRPRREVVHAMVQPKLLLPTVANGPRVAFDTSSHFVGHSVYMIASADRYLQGVLGSRVLWYWIRHVALEMRGRYRLTLQELGRLPIPNAPSEVRYAIGVLAERLSRGTEPNLLALQSELDDRVAELYGLTSEPERRLLEGLPFLPAEDKDLT